MAHDGILSDPIDAPARRTRREYRPVPADSGRVIEHIASGTTGSIVRYRSNQVTLRDRHGRDRTFRVGDGAFSVDGEPIALRPPTPEPTEAEFTASGSLDTGPIPARIARPSRIYVEGLHDAELIEKVWGDDLRAEGVVVEPTDGIDDLATIVRRFGPGPGRRLGVLVDHLVEGTKESRIAAGVDHPDVLVAGHPYVDIWQAVKPRVLGIESWPIVPMGTDWKTGVLDALGHPGPSGAFWKQLLGKVRRYTDLEPGLVGAVERLIDFVAPPED